MEIEFSTNPNEEINESNKKIGILYSFSLLSMKKFFNNELNGNYKDEVMECYNNSDLKDKYEKDWMNIATKRFGNIRIHKSLSNPTFYFLFHENNYVGSFRLIKKEHMVKIKYLGDITEIALLLVNPKYRRRKVAFNMLNYFLNMESNVNKKFLVRINSQDENIEIKIKLFLKLNFKSSVDYSNENQIVLIR